MKTSRDSFFWWEGRVKWLFSSFPRMTKKSFKKYGSVRLKTNFKNEGIFLLKRSFEKKSFPNLIQQIATAKFSTFSEIKNISLKDLNPLAMSYFKRSL